ncbi:MAG TPA: 23S rRNA (adenine(2503)-C(2))-methyltransferase RlmN [Bacteriovoracaceae bacterium]|nr:23S rRNA (adenine(2503)-C(2))-methyltransferase RlmN [Bacteriovoracaceae bacterium]
MKPSFYDLTFDELKALLTEKGLSPFGATQIYDWVYKKWEFDPANWSNVSKATKEFFLQNYDMNLLKIVWNGLSKDGTRKFLVKMADGQTVEAVAIPARERLTLCLSSQIGCAVGCTFCYTATQGLKRHLKVGEVVGQYVAVQKWLIDNVGPEKKLTNIVYMGQGEPLHNYENMKKATQVFMHERGMGLGQRRITLSTSGLVPAIEKLAVDFPTVNIAISLHSARNEVRTELMPINKVYDLEKLFKAIKQIPLKAHRRITYEYLLAAGINDTMEDVEALADLLNHKESKINLIPFNEFPGSKYKRPTEEKIMWFLDQMIKRGFTCTIRTTKGSDILAACGQLKSEYEKVNLWDKDSGPVIIPNIPSNVLQNQSLR